MRKLIDEMNRMDRVVSARFARWLHLLRRRMWAGHRGEDVTINGRAALIGCSCGLRFYRDADLLAKLGPCLTCEEATGGVCRRHAKPECTCYEAEYGHQPGCALARRR